ncbi:glycosyltransferase family 2 protein [Algoriphagus sp. AGSA1]|uniref:glycosyltransferase family 2 protein n=1 Tax=Algoriphagus sp. AGSA1 TaxID=2907213 RepID=UPI001F2F8C60|nr:glycosyltransferase family 2 protein [Algoriphagus sp. AGSA1]MCE7057563.1 glycosyltransferase family 2 protein [Algoriphagus sp. AGSA1]
MTAISPSYPSPHTPPKKSVSIVIPNYNGVALLGQYLPYTFAAAESAGVAYEVIVVDDCSTDSSVEWIRSTCPGVVLLVNSANLGFSITCNRGIKAAKNELVLLLNTDVALERDYFERLWRYFEQEDTFGVMGKIMNPEGKIEDAARLLSFSGMKFKATRFFYCEDKNKMTPTAYLSGANALVRREMLLKLGGFDEIYSPFYCEDVDLSFRAWRMGWKCYYEHEAVCKHEVSKTIRSSSSKNRLMAIVYRNKFILHAIHLDGIRLVFWYCQMFLIEVLLRIVVGKLWILTALRGFFEKKESIIESRKNLKLTMGEQGQTQSLRAIKKKYFDPMYARRIKRI